MGDSFLTIPLNQIPDWVPECTDCGECCTKVLGGLPPREPGEPTHPDMVVAIASLPVLPMDERSPCGLLVDRKCAQYDHRPKECVRFLRGGEECLHVLEVINWPRH